MPTEGSFHVRSTYAALDLFGVKGDGYDEGVERTRAHNSGPRESTLRAANTIADPAEKRREPSTQQVALLSSPDR